MKQFAASQNDEKKRLDVFVVEKFPLLSRAFVQKLSEEGKILVNNAVQKHGFKLHPGDKIAVNYDTKELEQIPDIDIPVLYEDEDCIVINKPTGLLTHSKGAFNPEATVATWLRRRLDLSTTRTVLATEVQERIGIVHRLDRGTSGVMICAKNPNALAWLQKQFSTRKVKKRYLAIVTGELKPSEAIIDMPIERNPRHPQRFRVSSQGKPATTQYKVLEVSKVQEEVLSMVELYPQTGRTHQLRVHLRQLGHPIVGDTFYEGKPTDRLYLHASRLELTLPSHIRKVFTATLPEEFKKYMDSAS